MSIIITQDNFEETIKSGVILVDFWAEWCGPCQMMLPILEDFSKLMEGKMNVGKINVDENQALAAQFRVMSIPTLIIFKDWKAVETLVWVQDVARLKDICWKYL